ncbi:Cof-type HAD-IIB family hydrolase [Mesohalobacter halotolerans]|uniref:Trehalose 6-phosphate synthase n=1 Tax=Mesohalobacter halotolerans TaxID=1883405 RepID=A0A4U5TPR0_9FLAO|nr:trehalose 6-phosphate synthase [Mesohalobacter halotolerans]TKS55418.1 trehalose 6-phosphate synthase [Mesohalobacter halotolerans]
MKLEYLADFYAQMRLLRETRASIVNTLKSPSKGIDSEYLVQLDKIENQLKNIPQKKDLYQLKTHDEKLISLELYYELGDLKKDRIYLKQGQQALVKHLSEFNLNFDNDLKAGLKFLKEKTFSYFISDRDGTVSNYCGRYQSSVQSIYNAMYLSSFSKCVKDESVILTSAPLHHLGLLDISVQPQGEYALAGSKGRELVDTKNKTFNYPIEKQQQQQLDELNSAIEDLLKKPKYSSFKYIGSGLQYKFGQTTLARQDKNGSIPQHESLDLKDKINEILKSLDPEEENFKLEDTGKDLEIMLTVQEKDSQKVDFNKGHGVSFIANTLQYNFKNQPVLICGDTTSDLPMLDAAKEMEAILTCIFVTNDDDLKQKVYEKCEDALIVSSPDALVSILYQYSKNKNT